MLDHIPIFISKNLKKKVFKKIFRGIIRIGDKYAIKR